MNLVRAPCPPFVAMLLITRIREGPRRPCPQTRAAGSDASLLRAAVQRYMPQHVNFMSLCGNMSIPCRCARHVTAARILVGSGVRRREVIQEMRLEETR